jgi:hypothetical protein
MAWPWGLDSTARKNFCLLYLRVFFFRLSTCSTATTRLRVRCQRTMQPSSSAPTFRARLIPVSDRATRREWQAYQMPHPIWVQNSAVPRWQRVFSSLRLLTSHARRHADQSAEERSRRAVHCSNNRLWTIGAIPVRHASAGLLPGFWLHTSGNWLSGNLTRIQLQVKSMAAYLWVHVQFWTAPRGT